MSKKNPPVKKFKVGRVNCTIWNNEGDTATLSGPRGRTIDEIDAQMSGAVPAKSPAE